MCLDLRAESTDSPSAAAQASENVTKCHTFGDDFADASGGGGVVSLVCGSTVTQAAEPAGATRETALRWARRDPDFIGVRDGSAEPPVAGSARSEKVSVGSRTTACSRISAVGIREINTDETKPTQTT
jgi:hypothetical protein